MQLSEQTVHSQSVNHLGLVGALCQQLGIADRINQLLGPCDRQREVSPGTCAVAMILNGLGFTERRLYLTPRFFENKPVERLLGEAVKASQLTEHALGRTLDDIADYGCTKLFSNVAFALAIENDLLSPVNHIDTTSFTLHGDYAEHEKDEAETIEITYGYSKEHRPDLKQMVLSMIVNGPADLPVWIESLDGNSSDKTSFHDSIRAVREFQSQIQLDTDFRWVADSALYNQKKLQECQSPWLTRVPETLKKAKALVQTPDTDIQWQEQGKGYKTQVFINEDEDFKQRWLLVYSEQAFEREKKTFEKRLVKEREGVERKLRQLCRESFQCEADAVKGLSKLRKSLRHFTISAEIVPLTGYKKRGRPQEGEQPGTLGYQVTGAVVENEPAIEKTLNTKGRFILATNEMDTENFTDAMMLSEYKSQQGVERGFRFLKDPGFMADRLYLKSPRRIEALMVIMCLSLLVYNFGQYQLRKQLTESGEHLPNQKNKPIQNPTLRWVFFLMDGITSVQLDQGDELKSIEIMTNLNPLRKKIIELFGEQAKKQYGLAEENSS